MSQNAHPVFTPPHSADAERAVLGAILTNPDQFHTVVDKVSLKSEHFFIDTHRYIYNAMVELESEKAPIELFSLSMKLSHGKQHINHEFLISLVQDCPLTQNIEYYANTVKQKYFPRKIITVCQESTQQAFTVEGNVAGFIEQIEQNFLNLTKEQDSQNSGFKNAKQVLIPTLEELERRISFEGSITGISSGFIDLDRFTSGWQKSDLIILAARPGMGKTALALNWIMNALKNNNETITAIFTLEMSKEQLMERLLSSEARIDSVRLRRGDLTEDDQDRLMHGARFINNLGGRLVIDETPGISLAQLRSRCRRYKREFGLDLIVIDYLQLMTASDISQKQGREREIGEISMGLKALAKELAVPVIACAQLNRGPDARPDKRPRISDLRESGSMEQDADLILFVYRDEYYNPNSEHAGKAEVLVSKNRHGETGSLFLAWLPNFVSFHNLLKN